MLVSTEEHAARRARPWPHHLWRSAGLGALAAAISATVTPAALAQTPTSESAKAASTAAKKTTKAAKPQEEDAAAKATAEVAAAEKSYEAGVKASQAGKHDAAVQSFSSALQGGKLPKSTMAKALYQRGIAQRKLGRPAQAIADLTSASWLKGGLTEAERADAMAQRAAAYKEAGIATPPGTVGAQDVAAASASPAATTTSRSATPAAPAPAEGWSTSATKSAAATAAAPGKTTIAAAPSAPTRTASAAALAQPGGAAQPSSGGIGSFFSGLFGGGASAAAGAASTPSRIDTAATNPPNPAVSAWSQGTAVAPRAGASAPTAPRATTTAAAPQAAATAPAATAASQPAAAAAKADGKHRLQVGAVRSAAEAKGIAERLRKEHASSIGPRETAVEETVLGNMGTFYRVSIGPFADTTEPQALCGKIRSSGLDCLVATR